MGGREKRNRSKTNSKMLKLNPNIFFLFTLNISIKRPDCQIDKNKERQYQVYVAYKRYTLKIMI